MKSARLSKIFSQFTEKNKDNLIRTAQSLIKIQRDSEAIIASNDLGRAKSKKPERSEL